MKMKTRQMNLLSESEKAINTRIQLVNDIAKVKQVGSELQNLMRSQYSKMAMSANRNNKPISPEDMEAYDIKMKSLILKFRDVTAGVIEQYRTRKFLAGIRPHGVQMAMFQPKYLEAGTMEASTHKGGIANAK